VWKEGENVMSHASLVSDIILIGPIRSGKSTLGRLLAERLDVPQISMDALCWDYYREIGFYAPDAEVHNSDGMIASRFVLHALERLLSDHRECVIDLGGGHSVHRDSADLLRMQQALNAYPNVFLLLPSPDLERSAVILAERNQDNPWLQTFLQKKGWNPNELFLRHPSHVTLARHIIYTEGKSPEQTRDEILHLLEEVPKKRSRDTKTKLKSEMLQKLSQALDHVEEGRLRSLVLMTALTDGEGECWCRITTEEDRAGICNDLKGLSQDMECL
jgi:shikimate kinase